MNYTEVRKIGDLIADEVLLALEKGYFEGIEHQAIEIQKIIPTGDPFCLRTLIHEY